MANGLKKEIVLGSAIAGAVGAFGLYMYMSNKKQKEYKRVATVAKLYLHPVKSLKAIEVDEGEVTSRGFKSNGIYDRSFMVVDEEDRAITARKCPKMILIEPSFAEDEKHLVLSVEGKEDLYIPLDQQGTRIESRVWGIPVSGYDCGEEVAKWLSDYLEGTYRMVFYSEELPAKLLTKDVRFGVHMKDNETSLYQDCTQFLIISEASMEDLNTRIEEPVTERNFRPNIYVTGCSAYAEDFWKYVKVGEEAEMRFTHFCGRCKMTTLNHETGSFISLDPLKTLKEYRQCYSFVEDRKSYATSPIFGTNLNLENKGVVRVGDEVFATYQYQEHAGNKLN
ncbi:mitochondrial amidoxime-reducing component 1-like [Apostichopus japonicus]|uniref:mitochondrial amidoxime-reducing component 1-like n=1 Tax=Stichopus japonicus TaxID=307972 RepID=UPI003AB2292F